MTQTTNTTRLDPLNNVMSYELLTVAHKLLARGQSEGYWAKVPVPKRPVGQVRFEVARQVATFAVPMLMMVWAYLAFGLKGAMVSVPLAWLTGYLLDKQLDSAITAKCRRDEKIDAGRYRAVKWMCAQMGLHPEEVTLALVRKMDKDYTIVTKLLAEKLVKHQAAVAAAKDARIKREERRGSKSSAATVAAAGTAAAVADTYFATEVADDDAVQFGSSGFIYNPDSGLAMVTPLMDSAGNTFGSNINDAIGNDPMM